MSYIKNKLDELIETYRKENVPEGPRAYFTEYDARMIAERLVADYHNHIVEMIQQYEWDFIEDKDYDVIIKTIIGQTVANIISLLQDTNPASQDKE